MNPLKVIRAELGLTQKAFGEIVGVGTAYVGKIEIGQQAITPRFVRRVVKALPRVNPEFLLNGEGIPLLPERPPTAEERRQRLIDSIRDLFDQLDPSVQAMIEKAIVNRQKARTPQQNEEAQPAPPAKKNGGP